MKISKPARIFTDREIRTVLNSCRQSKPKMEKKEIIWDDVQICLGCDAVQDKAEGIHEAKFSGKRSAGLVGFRSMEHDICDDCFTDVIAVGSSIATVASLLELLEELAARREDVRAERAGKSR